MPSRVLVYRGGSVRWGDAMKTFYLLLVTSFVMACSDQDGGSIQATDVGQVIIDVVTSTDTGEPDAAGQQDLHVAQDMSGGACEPGDGCFEEPCMSGEDCLSGICTMHLGGKVCSRTCDESCPEGWSCTLAGAGSDAQYVCLSNYSHLCLPCETSQGCLGDKPNACVSYGQAGSFCGGACELDQPCPDGYSCQLAQTMEGVESYQCVNDAGVCSCSSLAVESAMTTPCVNENEFGSCIGVRACTTDGLSECSAMEASSEVCNGVDDDCDGDVDEATCDDGNPCTEDSCVEDEGCTYTPLVDVECLDGDPCTVADHCENGECVGSPVTCNDDNVCTDDSCDGAGGCLFAPLPNLCDDGDACTVGDVCADGMCVGSVTLVCDDNNPCTDDACGETGCVFTANESGCDDGSACTSGDACEGGECAGAVLSCDDDNPCTFDGCDPILGCVNDAHTLPCDDGDACTIQDTCADGACASGAAMSCEDGNACTEDACQNGQCAFISKDGPCDDGIACTTSDVCQSGSCVGSALDCDDNNLCTTDFCDPSTGCVSLANAVPCDDGDVCTIGDMCENAGCAAGENSISCEDGNPCTDDSCAPQTGCVFIANTDPCDDNNSCTTNDTCKAGNCSGLGNLACDDGNACTVDSCLPDGGCDHVITAGVCDDGDACTMADTCVNGECVSGNLLGCDDGNPCTDETCLDGNCVFSANENPCDDGNACTIDAQCTDGSCLGVESLNCDDFNNCTDDMCKPDSGCVHTANEQVCNDGDPCTLGDVCAQGACQAGQKPLSCDDGNSCTDDGCEPGIGCTFTGNDAACDDGNACSVDDQCVDGWCTFTTVLACDDGNPCTDDTCDAQSGCAALFNEAPCSDDDLCSVGDACKDGACTPGVATLNCDDGLYCNGEETCNPDTGCVAGDAPSVDDGIECTFDTCDEDADEVVSIPTDGLCSVPQDSLCKVGVCDPQQGCLIDDQLACCGNSIVEAGESCDDGNVVDDDACTNLCQLPPVGTPSNPATSCKHVLQTDPNSPDGTYTMDFDGEGGLEPISVYCDMTEDGGGWMRMMGAQWQFFFDGGNWSNYNMGNPLQENYSILQFRSYLFEAGCGTWRFQVGNSSNWTDKASMTHFTAWKQCHDPFTQTTNGSGYTYIAGVESTTCGGFNGLHHQYQGFSFTSDPDSTDSNNCWWMQVVPHSNYNGSGYLEGYDGPNYHIWQVLWLR